MPELPEVEVCATALRSLTGLTIVDCSLLCSNLRKKVPPTLPSSLIGKTFRSVVRKGKWLVFSFSEFSHFLVHMGMTGRLLLDEGRQMGKHVHFFAILSDGRRLLYEDARRFGLLSYREGLLPDLPEFRGVGLDPLLDKVDGEAMSRMFASKKTPIKTALMDAKLVSGIGNIYASEVLFDAGLSPFRRCDSLSSGDFENLSRSLKKVLRKAILCGGTTFRDYRHPDGSRGEFAKECRVFSRGGEKCFACGGVVVRAVQSGRSTFYCAVCQPLHP